MIFFFLFFLYNILTEKIYVDIKRSNVKMVDEHDEPHSSIGGDL